MIESFWRGYYPTKAPPHSQATQFTGIGAVEHSLQFLAAAAIEHGLHFSCHVRWGCDKNQRCQEQHFIETGTVHPDDTFIVSTEFVPSEVPQAVRRSTGMGFVNIGDDISLCEQQLRHLGGSLPKGLV